MTFPVLERTTEQKPMMKLKGTRVERGYTQERLAYLLGISPSTYCRKEKGAQEFTLYEIECILRIFGSQYEDLFAVKYRAESSAGAGCQGVKSCYTV